MKKTLVLLMMLSLVLGSVFAQGGAEASAENYPSGPVSVIVPYSAGGGTDLVCSCSSGCSKRQLPEEYCC